MNLRRALAVAAVVLLVVVAAVVGGLYLYAEYLYRDSYGSDYAYRVHVAPSATVTNVTLLVPLPVRDGEPVVDAATVSHPFTPDGWAYDVVETEYGPMLRIRADEIPTDPTYHYSVVRNNRLVGWKTIPASEYDPNNASHVRATHEEVDVSATVESDRTLDTRAPIESEALLRPQANRTSAACRFSPDEEGACYAYSGWTFLSYDAATETGVYVSVELRGANSWWVFGWNGNEYVDDQSVEVVGPQDGWVATEGRLETGRGNYRNPPR
ncbi:MAG: hypothetical protein ABEJ28_08120 [Salinigranum sp.]